MRIKVWASVVILCLLGGAWVWFLAGDKVAPQQPEITGLPPVKPSRAEVASVQASSPLSPSAEETPADRLADADLHADQEPRYPDQDPEGENPYLNREVKARLAQVADDYAAQIQYPSFSKPIANREALPKYLPNRSFDAERPLDLEDENSPRILLHTDKQHYFPGEVINVELSLSGLSGSHQLRVQARLIGEGQTLAEADGIADAQQGATYRMILAGPEAVAGSGVGEYRVVAKLNLDGRAYEIGTPVSYAPSVSEVTYVGMAQVSGEYLNIPVDVTTTKPGYHELAANLYSEKSGKPLVHLSVQKELISANELMYLQAHVAALKAGGDPGPYVLQDIVFTRMPSPPAFTTEYGASAQEAYVVKGYAFNEYDDVPYVDEAAQDRLEFLQQLGDVE